MSDIGDVIGFLKSQGQVTLHSSSVDVLPPGSSQADFSDWQEASATEFFQAAKSLLGFEMVNLSVTARWLFNGKFISNFHVTVDGFVDKTHDVEITVTTTRQTLENADGVAELAYEILLVDNHILSGDNRATFRALVKGDGGGMSME
jgi:hypothetical protein